MDMIYPKSSGEHDNLLAHIITNYLLELYCICVLWQSSDVNQISGIASPEASFLENVNFQTKINANDRQLVWLKYDDKLSNNTDELTELGINVGCQAFIVTSGQINLFLDSYDSVRFSTENRYHLMHIVLMAMDLSKKEIQEKLNHSVFHDVPNILIISENLENRKKQGVTYDVITHRFVGSKLEDQMQLIDTFYTRNATFHLNNNLFPDKLNDLQKRVLRVAMFNYKPYTILTEVPPGEGNANEIGATEEKTLYVDGTDGLIFLIFCAKHNCTLEISIDEEGEWGIIYDNRTGDGILGAVSERRVDVGIGALYSWHHEFIFLDFSAPITRTGVVCIVPRPRLLGGLILPGMPFQLKMWIGVLLSYLSVVASLILTQHSGQRFRPKYDRTKHKSSNDDSPMPIYVIFLDIFGVFLSQSSYIPTKWIPEIIVVGVILLISLMIGNAYAGGLASILTIPHYEAPIDTVRQLSDSNIEWGATHDAWVNSILNATGEMMERLVKKFRAYPVETLEKHTTTRDFAFTVERLPWGNFAIGSYITENTLKYLQLMKTDIYYEYCVAMSFKTWSMKTNLDILALRIAESGIQRYWELQATQEHSDSKTQLGITLSRHQDNQSTVSLRPDHVIGILLLWLIGMSISLIVFVAELLIGRYKKKKRETIIEFYNSKNKNMKFENK